MANCEHIKLDGSRCKGRAIPPARYCWAHDPARADERQQAGHKGGVTAGRGRPLREIGGIKALLDELVKGVQAGTVEIAAAYCINALLSTKLRAVELERKLKEQEELEARIAALEASTGAASSIGGATWGR